MGDNKKWTRRAAVGSLVSGGGLMLFGTGGSTQISTYRDVAVNTGDGEDAVLQFDEDYDGGVVTSDAVNVYEITDNVDAFELDDIAVEARVDGGTVDATVTGGNDTFDVAVRCSDNADGLRGSYAIELIFTASNPDFTITATRTTGPVEIDCYDFGSSNNYRDSSDEGTAAQPDDPKGTIDNPGNVNDGNDDTYATAVAVCNSNSSGNSGNNGNGNGNGENGNSGGDRGGRVGYALPPTQQNGAYELYVKYKNSNGKWNVYLRDIDGNDLTEKYRLTGGGQNERSKTIEFDRSENSAIGANAGSLYLIFETTSSGNCVSVDVDYFELRRTGASST
ncbi:hypothetical protein PM076_06835 [Halorubrum ezzemoulense]|jgi:hypothetical protein|uniref:SipW-cognate class signal peptide n=3 Tax=Halorubrum ezzemoulense TaxID=337243 RepID=A0ABT4Z5S3_HALEZ|nr:hypothetical protein [Halorubrum ezzemoulense]MDB2251263.1 hypothetical protein [Halorubrum ezzemoulense]MDB2276927.1 hypothetical protein [Halorubrum ezzemoulense]MDB2286623.1 hypothetical protein [Halorubrum ezzemoulense]MDB2288554.1 hypothetical protein [Halorubrum ezzemoulense]MDB2293437.1 hypothetical protein [Halorubrum ezzemoulense]